MTRLRGEQTPLVGGPWHGIEGGGRQRGCARLRPRAPVPSAATVGGLCGGREAPENASVLIVGAARGLQQQGGRRERAR